MKIEDLPDNDQELLNEKLNSDLLKKGLSKPKKDFDKVKKRYDKFENVKADAEVAMEIIAGITTIIHGLDAIHKTTKKKK